MTTGGAEGGQKYYIIKISLYYIIEGVNIHHMSKFGLSNCDIGFKNVTLVVF